MKKNTTFIAINILFSLFYSLIKGFSRYSFINCSFTIGIFYLLFGTLCFVWERGFFNISLFSFNKIYQQLQKRKGVLVDEPDIKLRDYANKQCRLTYTNSLLISGIIISILTSFVSFYIYY